MAKSRAMTYIARINSFYFLESLLNREVENWRAQKFNKVLGYYAILEQRL